MDNGKALSLKIFENEQTFVYYGRIESHMPNIKLSKAEIIRISMEEFSKRGYANTSMQHLADACGLKKGSFYNHFKSKEELMEATLQYAYDQFKELIFSIAFETDRTALERFTHMAKRQRKIVQNYYKGCYFADTLTQVAFQEVGFKRIIANFFDDWKKALAHLYQELDVAHPKIRAERSIQEVEGAIVMMKLYEDPNILNQTVDRLIAEVS